MWRDAEFKHSIARVELKRAQNDASRINLIIFFMLLVLISCDGQKKDEIQIINKK